MNTPCITNLSLAIAIACAGSAQAGEPEIFTGANVIIADASGATPGARAYAFAGTPEMLGHADLSRFMAMEMGDGGKVVKDAPYSAEAVTETTQALADGNRITRKTATLLYRDALGRTRQEQTAPGSTVFLNDPVSGKRTILNTDKKTATILPGFRRFAEKFDMSKLHELAKLGKAQIIHKSADGEKAIISKGADGEMQIIRKAPTARGRSSPRVQTVNCRSSARTPTARRRSSLNRAGRSSSAARKSIAATAARASRKAGKSRSTWCARTTATTRSRSPACPSM